jgi:hypothetical protein
LNRGNTKIKGPVQQQTCSLLINHLAELDSKYLSNLFPFQIWNKDNGRAIRTLIGHTDEAWALELLKNDELVSGSCDASIII